MQNLLFHIIHVILTLTSISVLNPISLAFGVVLTRDACRLRLGMVLRPVNPDVNSITSQL